MLSKQELETIATEFIDRYADMLCCVGLEQIWYVRDGRKSEFKGRITDTWHCDYEALEIRRLIRDFCAAKGIKIAVGHNAPMRKLLTLIGNDFLIWRNFDWVNDANTTSWHNRRCKRRWRLEDSLAQ